MEDFKQLEEAVLQQWFNTYIKGFPSLEDKDLHQQFADEVGMDRHAAEVLCYKIMYRVPLLKSMMDDVMVLGKCVVGEK